jgi:peptide/nickel transport system permease protein
VTRRRLDLLIARRALHAVPLVFGVVTLTFLLIHAAPGDPVYMMAGDGGDAAYYAAMRAHYGLDRPLAEQYVRYLRSVAVGDFGFSYAYQEPVFAIVREHLPATLLLSGSAFVLAVIVGLAVGLLSASAPDSPMDVALRTLTALLYSAPVFWIGQLLLLAFAVGWPLFPVGGIRSVRESTGGAIRMGDLVWHLALPAAALTIGFFAPIARVARASLIVERCREYIRAVRARGVSPAALLVRHALPNALLPIVTVTGHEAGVLITAAGLTEAVFGWPGIGHLLLEASTARDYPLIIAILLTSSLVVVLANVVTDAAYAWLDPRVEI